VKSVAIIITGLSTGGAEVMLLKLLEHIDRNQFSFHVFSLTDLGDVGPRIAALGVPVEAIGMARGTLDPRAVFRLARRLREIRPDLVHTWMYHADLLGGLAARFAGVRAIAWALHNTNLDCHKTKASTRLVVRLNALASHWLPSGILSCAVAARDIHAAIGFAAHKIVVIPNGFDVSRYRPDPSARTSVREELRVSEDTPLVGVVGRFDPQKNHAGFIEAAGLLRHSRPDVHFVLVGAGLDAENHELAVAAQCAGLDAAVHWLGRRGDMPRLMAAFDVLASSSSYGEAFPMVIGEAMACGVLCAVTDVGDSAAMIAHTGRVVPPGDMRGLAGAMHALLALDPIERIALADAARERIEQHFEIGHVARQYEGYYRRLIGSVRHLTKPCVGLERPRK
jgi:glycosyltransferase involved in cell wall biosynthesis